jgi:DHA2 family multidrug resistance protein
MLPIGQMLKYFNPKYMVLFGLVMGELAVYTMTRLSDHSGASDVLVPLMFRGMGVGFLFVPINQMVLGSVEPRDLAEVASMQNFFRQMGGSIGITSLDTLISRFSAQNYNDLMIHVNALNPAGQQALAQGQGFAFGKMASMIGMWSPETLAIRAIHGRALVQTFLMSFGQLCWTIMLIVALAVIPLILIKPKDLRKSKLVDAH